MQQSTRFLVAGAFALAATGTVLAPGPVEAQAFPAKPITLIVPYAPGGTGDILGRALATELAKTLGQNVVVENRAGAGGNIGAEVVAKNAKPDGYTILLTATSLASNPSLMKKMGFDPVQDLAPVAGMATMQNLVVVPATSPFKTMQELIAHAKAKPGSLSFGSSGNGTSNHLAVELFKMLASVDAVHVPYKSAGQALPDLVSGRVDFMFDLMPSAIGQVKQGKLRALAVTGAKRSSVLPDLPTVAEAGVPGYEFSAWFGVFAPAATPKDVVARLNAGINQALASPELKERLAQQGADPYLGTPEQFAAYFRGEVEKWAKVVKQGRLPPID